MATLRRSERRGGVVTPQEIEAELGYAYLHAVASAAGVACQEARRGLDNAGIDATLHVVRDFGPAAKWTEISLHVQLKATTLGSAREGDRHSYFLRDVCHYDRLRAEVAVPPRILAVLFLPGDRAEWLCLSPDELVLRRAAYWVSLAGAPACENTSGKTVYLPESQLLSPEGLVGIFRRLAHQERLRDGE